MAQAQKKCPDRYSSVGGVHRLICCSLPFACPARSLQSAAMGSEEGFNVADKAHDSIVTALLTLLRQRGLQRWQVFEAIKAASNAGSWVLLKCCGGSVQAMKSCSHYRCALCPKRLVTASRNVHLAIKWLSELVSISEFSGDASSASRPCCKEKKLYGMNPQQNFRLFLTMEFNPRP